MSAIKVITLTSTMLQGLFTKFTNIMDKSVFDAPMTAIAVIGGAHVKYLLIRALGLVPLNYFPIF